MMSSEEKFIGPVNLGNPVEFKIIDLAKTIIKLTNSKSNIVNKELPTDDPIRENQIYLSQRMSSTGNRVLILKRD